MSEDLQRRKDWRKYLKTPLAEKLTLSIGTLFFQKADDSFEPKFFQPEEFEKPCLAIAAAMAGSCYKPRLTEEIALGCHLRLIYLTAAFWGVQLYRRERVLVFHKTVGTLKKLSGEDIHKLENDVFDMDPSEMSEEAVQAADYFIARTMNQLANKNILISGKKFLKKKAFHYLSSCLTLGYLFAREMTKE